MVQYFPVVTGSLTVTGSINVSGGITASGGISISGSIASASFASTASFIALAQSASNAVAAATASFANAFTVAGNLTAQTLVVQTITSSVDFVTGSTRFGSTLGNTHQFTGSVSMTGSLAVVTNGTEFQVTSTGVNFGNALTDSHIISGSLTINPNGLFVSSSGNVGIGITDLGPTGLSLPATSNYAWSEGSGNAYAVLFRQRNSGATVIASGYKRSNTAGFASSFGTSMSRAAIAIGSNNGSIAFFSDSATNVANGTDMTPTERMTITNVGSVGIGITSPGASLAVANTTVGIPSIPSLGSINGYTTAFFSNSNPVYGLLMGSLYNGNTWMQVGRIDGTATAYDLQLQPNGGGVNVGGRLSVGGNVVLSQKLITSFTSNPSNVSSGGTTSFSLTQPTFEYQSTYFVSIIGLYAPSGVNQNGFYTGLVTFFNDSSNAQANVSALHANGWSLSVSATTGGTFSGTFTNSSGATMSNVWIRILKINKTFDN